MGSEKTKPRIQWPKEPPQGFKRKWVQCKGCKTVMHYIYQPFSLSNPILTKSCCSHGMGGRFHESVRELTAEQAAPLFIEQQARFIKEKP